MLLSVVNELPVNVQSLETVTEVDLSSLSNDCKDALQITLQFLRDENVERVCVLLRVLLFRALKYEHLADFYECFEAVAQTFSKRKLAEIAANLFDPKMPQFITDLEPVSNGLWSINFLRILKTFITRLDKNRFSEERGLSIGVLARVKGFAHRARLNKRSVEYEPIVYGLDAPSDPENCPEDLIQYLHSDNIDPSRVTGAVKHAGDVIIVNQSLIRGIIDVSNDRANVYDTETNGDWTGITWLSMTPTSVFRLIAQLTFEARRISLGPVGAILEKAVNGLVNRIAGKARALALKDISQTNLANSFNVDKFLVILSTNEHIEPIWEQWKDIGCPEFDFKDAEVPLDDLKAKEENYLDAIAAEVQTCDKAIKRPLPPLNELPICNGEVSRVFKSKIYFDSFSAREATVTASEPPSGSSMDFLRLHSQPWTQTITEFEKLPTIENSRTTQLEEKLKQEKNDEEEQKKLRLKRIAENDESSNKRQIIYDDRRVRGAEVTAKPLPY